jgi:hypothetical protein
VGSLDIGEIYLSLVNYEPQVERINLKADVSASDHFEILLAPLVDEAAAL